VARGSGWAATLVRGVTYSLPAFVLEQEGLHNALAFSLLLGLLDGWLRVRVARNARSFVAEPSALVVASGLQVSRIAWPNVLAVEVWHRHNRLDYVAVHYRTTAGNVVATCWGQDQGEKLVAFVRQCAALAQAEHPRRTIVRAYLGDRGVYLPLLRRSSLDLAGALLVGLICRNPAHALWLGAAAVLVSTLLAVAPHLHRANLVLRDGVWWQLRANSEPAPLRVLPNSLRLWASCLSELAGGRAP